MNTRKRIIGIDFSAAQKAGKSIWIAEAHATPTGVRILDLQSVAQRLGETDRDPALAALREFLAEARSAVAGVDAPLSIPAEFIEEDDWRTWVGAYPDRCPDADALRDTCLGQADGRERRRSTDREASTPFSPYNLRLYKQTHHLIADVLAPLVSNQRACALPMQHRRDDLPRDTPWLLETCPASTLKQMAAEDEDFSPSSYKGTKPAHAIARRDIVDRFTRAGALEWSDDLREVAETNTGGDALDAALCALAVRRALAHPDSLHCEPGSSEAIEGRVYL